MESLNWRSAGETIELLGGMLGNYGVTLRNAGKPLSYLEECWSLELLRGLLGKPWSYLEECWETMELLGGMLGKPWSYLEECWENHGVT